GRRRQADPHVAHPALVRDPVGVESEALAEDAELRHPADRVGARVVTEEAGAEPEVDRAHHARPQRSTRLCRALARWRRIAAIAPSAWRFLSAAMMARCSSTA